jgi:nicotinate-nucleotide--dimethylbenzimidazole phosphoribosyltransferase
VTAALLRAEPTLVCGPGTGIDDEGLARKVDAVRRGLAANGLPRRDADPADVLSAVGGLEIAFLVGVTLGAAARRIPILLDGFVSSVAGLVAVGFRQPVAASLIAATRSPEPGHALVLESLGLEPLLDLGLRLGEGTGAALALPLVRSAIAILTDMATFDAAGVSESAQAVGPMSAAADA